MLQLGLDLCGALLHLGNRFFGQCKALFGRKYL